LDNLGVYAVGIEVKDGNFYAGLCKDSIFKPLGVKFWSLDSILLFV